MCLKQVLFKVYYTFFKSFYIFTSGIDQQDAPALPEEEEGPEGTAGLSVDLDPQPAADHPEVDRRGLHQGKRRVQKRSYGVVSEGHGVPKRRRNRTKNFRRHAAP